MPVDSGGNASRPSAPIPVSGQLADAPQVNVPIDDIYAILNMLAFLDGRKPLQGNIQMNGYRIRGAADGTQDADYVTLSQVRDLASSGVPTGAIMNMSGAAVPSGWVVANGQSLDRSSYSDLWSYAQSSGNIAATQAEKTHGQYGPGNGTSTFTLPNLYADGGYFIRPMSTGRLIGSVQNDELKAHSHGATVSQDGGHDHGLIGGAGSSGDAQGLGRASVQGIGGPDGNFGLSYLRQTGKGVAVMTRDGVHTHNVTVANTGGSETRPRNIAYPVIIKA